MAQCQIEFGQMIDALKMIAAPRDMFSVRSPLKCIIKAQVFVGLGLPHIGRRHCQGAESYGPDLSKAIADIFREMLGDGTVHHKGTTYSIVKRIEIDPRNYFPESSVTRIWAPDVLVSDIPASFSVFDIATPGVLLPKTALRNNLSTVVLARACVRLSDQWQEEGTSKCGIRDVKCDNCGLVITVAHPHHWLCDSCGTESTIGIFPAEPCSVCDGHHFTILAPAFTHSYCPCPYCELGHFKGDREGLTSLEKQFPGIIRR
jgi:hypothetical protein